MLSAFYYVILKVNLTTDSYLILKDGLDDQEKYFDSFTSIFRETTRHLRTWIAFMKTIKKEYT